MTTFIQFARAHGLELSDVWASDRVRRCATQLHPRKKNGAWWFDGRRGWVFAWDGDKLLHWWNDPHAAPWTPRQQAEWDRRRADSRAQRDARASQAAEKARRLIQAAKQQEHGYLRLKGLAGARGLVGPDEQLIVPMRHWRTNALVGAQVIQWLQDERRWEKKMLFGMRATGAVLRIGPSSARETILCEGYATGLSIDAACRQLRLSMAVLVCFSDSNLEYVAQHLTGPALVFADNDQSGAGERAAQASGLPYVMADTVGWDANDLHAERGLFAVSQMVADARRRMATAVT